MSPRICGSGGGVNPVDVVIPVLDPGRDGKLIRALTMLTQQTVSPGRIILMNTEHERYDEWEQRERIAERFPNLQVRQVARADFDHAATRNEGASLSDAPYLLFMTMDAVPADGSLIERLLAVLEEDPSAAVVYARQIPAEDAGPAEQFTRSFNYPEVSERRVLEDIGRRGIKAFFVSNVCALYRRSSWDRLGGFSAPAIFNEDMVFANAALRAGMSVHYCAEARVIHSHNYTASQQFHRNFDLGVSQAMHPEVFGRVRSEKEGKRLVSETLRWLKQTGHPEEIPVFLFRCAARYAGYRLGKSYRLLPRRLVLRCTNQKDYWESYVRNHRLHR